MNSNVKLHDMLDTDLVVHLSDDVYCELEFDDHVLDGDNGELRNVVKLGRKLKPWEITDTKIHFRTISLGLKKNE